mgnify:CR=1 FL=1
MIAFLERGECVAGTACELLAHAWEVRGHRFLGDGTEQLLTAFSWGATEERARAAFGRLQDIQDEQRRAGGYPVDPPWEDAQLTFCRIEESGGER